MASLGFFLLLSGAALLSGAWESNSWMFLDWIPLDFDTKWKELVSGTSCPSETDVWSKIGEAKATIRCTVTPDGRHIRFPAGMFDIDAQTYVPANTFIEGNANPVDPSDKAKEPDPAGQTYFIATHGVTDEDVPYCGSGNDLQPGGAERVRIGFLMNSNTSVKNINFQGRDTVRPHDNENLCGGGVFETPGCVSPGFGDGVGTNWTNKFDGCYDHAGEPNDLILGDGKGVENVLIDSVRLNGLLLPTDGDYAGGQASQVAVWVALTKDGSATKNVTVRNLVAMLLRGDGINFHGNVQDSLVEDCHIENTGDDIYAVWGGYAESSYGNVFRNNVGKNPGVARDYWYGVCVAIYGAKNLTVTGTKCYDLGPEEWNPEQVPEGNDICCCGANCNSCLAIVHGGWFGTVYPDDNSIVFYDNEYLYFDGRPIPDTDRPLIRNSGADDANIVEKAPKIEARAVTDGVNDAVKTSGSHNLLLCTIAGALSCSAAVGWRRWRSRERDPRHMYEAAVGASSCEDAMIVE